MPMEFQDQDEPMDAAARHQAEQDEITEAEAQRELEERQELAAKCLAIREAADAARQGPTLSLSMTWAGALPMLLAVAREGLPEGRRQAEAELLRMAKVADLATRQAREAQAATDAARAPQAPVDLDDAPHAPELDDAELATILAALRFYQAAGMGDPFNRSDAIHEIATNGGEVFSSLDAEGIDQLCEKLNVA